MGGFAGAFDTGWFRGDDGAWRRVIKTSCSSFHVIVPWSVAGEGAYWEVHLTDGTEILSSSAASVARAKRAAILAIRQFLARQGEVLP